MDKKNLKIKKIDINKFITKCYLFDIFQIDFNFIESEDPDIVFFSDEIYYKKDKLNEYKNKVRVFISHENSKPTDYPCDFSFTIAPTTKNNFQMPWFALHENFYNNLERLKKVQGVSPLHENFCNFIYFNFKCKERIQFCEMLQNYKKVDCPGRVLNNMTNFGRGRHYFGDGKINSWMQEKLEFIKNYKFTLAFENKRAPYYVTEKIFHSFLMKSLPIYWGTPDINQYFNPKTFINVSDFENFDEAIKYIKKVDNDPELYASYFEHSPILQTSVLNQITVKNVKNRFNEIVKKIKRSN